MSNRPTHASAPLSIVEYGDNFIPVLPTEYLEHTQDRPFCWDDTCPCHRDLDALEHVAWDHHEGLCTVEEAGRLLTGKQI